jgi:CheY-like chemotaxis protein
VGGSPSTDRGRYEHPNSAPAYQVSAASNNLSDKSPAEDAVRLLMELLSKGQTNIGDEVNSRHPWKKRKALVCTPEKHREQIARCLTEASYQVFVAEDTRQAIETMRANQLDVVLLEPEFDATEQGAAFVVREINVLRPQQRRRLFFILLSSSLRTMDAHSAFLNNVNAVVNLADLSDLTRILEVALREYNELYREFNAAFNQSAL